ncbi:MAG: COX15/CtaA family protein [Caldimonas sp.]
MRRLAWLCAATVLAVTTLSAFIRLSGEGVGCVPWPHCYGERALRGTGEAGAESVTTATVVARLAHRVMASAALLIVVLLVMVCFAGSPRLGGEGGIALALLALALFLAVLGRWSSGARVPAIPIANLVGGFAMLALSLRLAIGAGPAPPRRRLAAAAALLVLIVQIAFGGLISASHSGLSCTGWSECAAAARAVPWSALDPSREPVLTAASPFNAAGALAQTVHRGLALLLVPALLTVAAIAWRAGLRRSAAVLVALLAAQTMVGLAMAGGSLPLAMALLHNVLAAALLVTLVLLV